MEKYRSFTVTPCLNGFVVKIGCQTAVFEKESSLIDAIQEYLDCPGETEKKWLEKSKELTPNIEPTISPLASLQNSQSGWD